MRRLLVLTTVLGCNQPVIRQEPEAIVYLPPGYSGEPMPILYWLHWYRGSADLCPPMHLRPNFIVVAPRHRREADWPNYDLPARVAAIETQYPCSERWLEGYSRGAYGAVWHASRRPDLFSRTIAIAGGYPDHPKVEGNLTIIAGEYDERWRDDSIAYAESLGEEIIWSPTTHHPLDFYDTFDWRGLYE